MSRFNGEISNMLGWHCQCLPLIYLQRQVRRRVVSCNINSRPVPSNRSTGQACVKCCALTITLLHVSFLSVWISELGVVRDHQ